MKKIVLVSILLAMMAVLGPSIALAEPANVIRDVGCVIFVGPYGGSVFDPDARHFNKQQE
jgi:hypothetical protein